MTRRRVDVDLPPTPSAPGYRDSLTQMSQFVVQDFGSSVAVAPREGAGATKRYFKAVRLCGEGVASAALRSGEIVLACTGFVTASTFETRSSWRTAARSPGAYAAEVTPGAPLETNTQIAQLRLAGLLRDVGTIGIPDSILNKPGPLTDEEFEVMKTHSALGHGIVHHGA